MRHALLTGLCLALAACSRQPPVQLRNADGVVVRCTSAAQGNKGQEKCIENFESQGFKRAS